jgi:membrane-bound serine protease (ClpP class)
MVPSGLIGDAMPILMSPLPMGKPQEVPDGLKEKVLSPTIALARSAAQAKGHDTKLAEAMIRPEMEYIISNDVISARGELLTLTSRDAARLVGPEKRPLLSKGTVKDMDELLARIGRSDTELVFIRITPTERIARLIEGFPMSGILLAIGLLGLYIEFKTPGFGVPGITGIICLAIWFWGHHIAGLAGTAELLVFSAGVILLLIEIFLIPGFGVTGVLGMTLMVVSLLMAMVEHYPGTPIYAPPLEQVRESMITLGFSLILTFAAGAVLTRFLPETNVFRRLALVTSMTSDEGYTAAAPGDDMVGLKGVAATPLRPAGLADFGNRRLNVVARGEFVEKDVPIFIAEAHGNRIVVEPCEAEIVQQTRPKG